MEIVNDTRATKLPQNKISHAQKQMPHTRRRQKRSFAGWWLCALIGFGLAPTAFGQFTSADTARFNFAVDELPRTESANSPSLAFDRNENVTFVWQAEDKGRSMILLRQFDAIGRPMAGGIIPVAVADDTVSVTQPHFVFTSGDSLWVAWQEQALRSENAEIVARVFNNDLKQGSEKFFVREKPQGGAFGARLIVDAKSRVLVAWFEPAQAALALPARVMARYFNSNGLPISESFSLYQGEASFVSQENLDLAASSNGLIAATWKTVENNLDRIYLCLFDDAGILRTPATVIVERNVSFPSLTFLTAEEIIMQWYETPAGARLLAQRFDLNAKPLDVLITIAQGAAGETPPSPTAIAAIDSNHFGSMWSALDTTEKEFDLVYGQFFDRFGAPVSAPQKLGRTPNDSSRKRIALDLTTSIYGNVGSVFDGTDRQPNSEFPRITGNITQFVLPDLSADTLQILNIDPTRADSIMAHFIIRNSGRAPAAASSLVARVFSQTTQQFVTIMPLEAPLLLPGETREYRINLGKFEPGLFFFSLVLDQTLVIPEQNEENNATSAVSFTVLEAPTISVSNTSMVFTTIFGESEQPPRQIFEIRNSGSGVLNWNAVADQPWLALNPASGLITTQIEQVTVGVDPGGLPAGTYLGNINLTSNGGIAVVGVTLVIRPAEPRLAVNTNRLRFAATQGSTDPPAQNISITNAGNSVLRWRVTSDQPWLSVFPDTGSTTQETDQIAVRAITTGLRAGTYSDSLVLLSNGGETTINVELEISALPAALHATPTSLNFTATEGLVNPPFQPVLVTNTGGGTLNWSTSEDAIWLSVFPSTGTTTSETDTIWVSASITIVRAGAYSSVFNINSNAGTQSITVNFLVNPQPPVLAVEPASLSFTGFPAGSNPPPQPLIIRNAGGGMLNWFATVDQAWLRVSPQTGDTRAELDTIAIAIDLSTLSPGSYNGTVRIASIAGDISVRVNLAVQQFPDLQAQLSSAALTNCLSPDYNFNTAFVVVNAGPGVSAPTTARLLLDGILRQQINVPELASGARFNVTFQTEALHEGFNTILFRAGSDTADGNSRNNSVVLREWVPQRGDANLDSLLDLRDIFYVIDVILQRRTSVIDKSCWAANTFTDELIDVADVVALVDFILQQEGSAVSAGSSDFELRLAPLAAAKTRLQWQTSQGLRAWQATWKLQGLHTDHPTSAGNVTSGAWEARWKIRNSELRLLVWSKDQTSPANQSEQTIDLPLAFAVDRVIAATGLSVTDEMLTLNLHAEEMNAELPQTFNLSAGYPNPLQRRRHAMMQWHYDLPEAAFVDIKIHNLLGQEIWRETPGEQPAGRWTLSWEGRNAKGVPVANGVYFLEFVAGKYRKLERFIVQ